MKTVVIFFFKFRKSVVFLFLRDAKTKKKKKVKERSTKNKNQYWFRCSTLVNGTMDEQQQKKSRLQYHQ